MKGYKLEVRMTTICMILISVLGGFLSVFFVLANSLFFNEVAVPAPLQGVLTSFFEVKSTVMGGFPLHYLLLILFSWIGATLIGAIWSLSMDKLEEQQRSQ